VLLAMLHVLFEEQLTDPPAYVRGIESVRLAVADVTPEYAAEASGVPADEIRRITREFAAADGAAAYGRLGLSTQGFGSVCQWAIQCLNILTGNFDREGGVLFPEPAVDIVGKAIVGRGHHDIWRSRVRGIPEFGGELPVSTMREEIDTPGEGQIRAVLTVAGNPVLSTPDGRRLGESLSGLDFMAAVDLYLNETTSHADVVLPPTSALEREQYDLVFHTFAVRNTARFTPPVFEKPEGAMHDWEIFREIALRTAARLDEKKSMAKALTERASLTVSPTTIVSTLLLTGRRTTIRALRSHPEGVDLGPLKPTMPERLQTQDKLIHLAPDLVVADLARLRETIAEMVDQGPGSGELVLIGRRHQRDNNSWMHNSERLTRGKPRHQLLMHPEDLAAHGLSDGTRVRVSSRVGEVTTEVRSTEDMMRGVVSLPHGYGHQVTGARMGNASKVAGVSVNDLTDPERLDISGNAALNGVPVTVLPAAPGT
jgi:anaerobic selenocysteine-containing dehydrogenase